MQGFKKWLNRLFRQSRPARTQAPQSVKLGVELLEDRVVPTAATISLTQGTLAITDMRANDTVVLRETNYRFSIDGIAGSLPANQVSAITISLPRGFDTVVISNPHTQWGKTINVLVTSPVGHNTFVGLRNGDAVRDPQLTGSVLMHYPVAQDWQAHGGATGVLGRPLGDPRIAGDGVGTINYFQNGAIYRSAAKGAAEFDGAAYSKWMQTGGINSPLGVPTGNEHAAATGQGRIAYFQGGAVYVGAAGAIEVQGRTYAKWMQMGGEQGELGEPLTNEAPAGDGVGRITYFQNGAIYYSAAATYEIQGLIYAKWQQMGGMSSPLGAPVSDEMPAGDGVGRISYFQHGAIYWSLAAGAHETHGAIYTKWVQMGGMNSALGAPVSDEQNSADGQGRISYFQGGAIYYNWTTGAHEVQGAIYNTWKALGGEYSTLGEPITNEEEANNGRVSYFQGGTINFDWDQGSTVSYGSPWAGFDNFVNSLSDPGLAGDVRTLTRDDGELSRSDVLTLFNREESYGGVSAGQLSDLQAIAANYTLLHMPYDVADLLGKVVGDNAANQTFQGNPLGDLYAGSDAQQLTALAAKWFLGGDLPGADLQPPVGPGVGTYATSYVFAQGSLFGPSGMPQYTDVSQGVVGDCYFLAALASVAYQSPYLLKQSIIDNGDSTYTIRFNMSANGQAPNWDYVTVDRMLPVYYRTDANGNPISTPYFAYNGWYNGQIASNPNNALWVGLYEKAYVQLAEEGWSRDADHSYNAYSAIGGGASEDALTQVTGRATGGEALDGPDVYSVLTQGVPNGQLALLSTPDPELDPNLAGGHVYAVLGYDAATGMVTLYNPWGFKQDVSYLGQDFNGLAFTL
jgi:uncharacterized protein with LGFP repeats